MDNSTCQSCATVFDCSGAYISSVCCCFLSITWVFCCF